MLPRTLPTEVQQALGEYVYALERSRNGKVFSIGRGIGDRVLHHASAAIAGPEATFQPFTACRFEGYCFPDRRGLAGRHTHPPVLSRSYGSAFRYDTPRTRRAGSAPQPARIAIQQPRRPRHDTRSACMIRIVFSKFD